MSLTNSNPLVSLIRRYWAYLILCAVGSAVAGAAVARKFNESTWQFSSLLLYAPGQVAAPQYQPPDVGTLTSLLKSPGMLNEMAEKFPPMSPKALFNLLRVEVPYGTQLISMQIESNTPEQGQNILNELTTRLQTTLAVSRRAALERSLHQTDTVVNAATERWNHAKQALRDFHSAEGVVDVNEALQHVRDEIDSLETSLRTTVSRTERATINDDTTQRRAMLRDLIHEEREAVNARNQLALKRNEFERARALHEKRYISEMEFQRVKTELQTLTELESGTVSRYRDKLKQYDTFIGQSLASTAPGATTDTGIITPDVAFAQTRASYEQLLAERRARLTHLLSLHPKSVELSAAVEQATHEKRRIDEQRLQLTQAIDSTARELTVLQPPQPTLDPVKTSTKKLFMFVTSGIFVCCIAPLLVLNLASRRTRPLDRLSADFGLTIISDGLIVAHDSRDETNTVIDDNQLRRLALRVQQSSAAASRSVLLTNINDEPLNVTLVTRLAECFAQRGERVLLLEVGQPEKVLPQWESFAASDASRGSLAERLRTTSESHPTVRSTMSAGSAAVAVYREVAERESTAMAKCGLHQYLADAHWSPHNVCRPTATAGLDIALSGQGLLPAEGLASQRMTDLIDRLRGVYSLILIAGPSIEESVDLQLAAARADLIVLFSQGSAQPSPTGKQTLLDLVQSHAPVIGVAG